jgi:hypothetical protein
MTLDLSKKEWGYIGVAIAGALILLLIPGNPGKFVGLLISLMGLAKMATAPI